MSITVTHLLEFYQHVGKFYSQQFRPLQEKTGLSLREIQILLFLHNNPTYDTAKDITTLLNISKSQVSQSVDLLAAEGLLSRTTDGSDRRIVHLALTGDAAPLVREGRILQDACGARLLGGFSPEELDTFLSLLGRVLDNGRALDKEVP